MLQFGTKFYFFQRHRVGEQHVHELAVDSTCTKNYKNNCIGCPPMFNRSDEGEVLCHALLLSMYSVSRATDHNTTEITQFAAHIHPFVQHEQHILKLFGKVNTNVHC